MSQLRTYPLAFALLAITLLYNVVEGVITIASGLRADSLVLLSSWRTATSKCSPPQ